MESYPISSIRFAVFTDLSKGNKKGANVPILISWIVCMYSPSGFKCMCNLIFLNFGMLGLLLRRLYWNALLNRIYIELRVEIPAVHTAAKCL